MTEPRLRAVRFWIAVGATWVALAARGGTAETSNPISAKDFDAAAFAQWVGGDETPVEATDGARSVFWSREGPPTNGNQGIFFGDGKTSGPRHLRVGWNTATPVGAVLVRGGGRVAALKAGAAYPGAMADESQWVAAERIQARKISRDEVGAEEYAIWVFPPRTATRALRFSHDATAADRSYAGWLGGACVLAERVANVAPQAIVHTGANDGEARRITNGTNDGMWKTWDNGKTGAAERVSPERPEWVTLIWPRPVGLRGLAALWAGFAAADVQAFIGDATANPLDASEGEWKMLGHFDKIENQYPRALGVNWLEWDLERLAPACSAIVLFPLRSRHGLFDRPL